MGLKLKWFNGQARVAGIDLAVVDNGDGTGTWSAAYHTHAPSIGQWEFVGKAIASEHAAQEAAEAALARLLTEDEGLRALLVGQWRDPPAGPEVEK